MPREFDGVTITKATDRAILADFGDAVYWIPQSQVHDDSDIWREGESGKLVITDWYADKMEAEHGAIEVTTADQGVMGQPVLVTNEQRLVFNQAVQHVRRQVGDLELSEGRALELLCADYIAGAGCMAEEER